MGAHNTHGFQAKHAPEGQYRNINDHNLNIKINKSNNSYGDGYNYDEKVLSINRAKGEVEKLEHSSEDEKFEVDEKKRNEYLFKRSGFADFDQFDFIANPHPERFHSGHSDSLDSNPNRGYVPGHELRMDDSHIGLLDLTINDRDGGKSGGNSNNTTVLGIGASGGKGNEGGHGYSGAKNGTGGYSQGQGGNTLSVPGGGAKNVS
jgi:hypothetical protein